MPYQMILFLHDDYADIVVFAETNSGVRTRRAASYDSHIAFDDIVFGERFLVDAKSSCCLKKSQERDFHVARPFTVYVFLSAAKPACG